MADLDDDTVTFFDLDESGVEMVFNLNFIGTLLPTQAFARQMVGRPGCNIMNISKHERLPAPDQDPGLLRLQGCRHQLHPVAGSALQQGGHPGQRHCPGLLCQRAERTAPLQRGRHPPPPAPKRSWLPPPMGRFGDSEKDLVGALLFLLNNEAAGFITGICLPIDGGFSAYSGV